MRALPTDKLPIKGSPGAALRRQQLQKQLPLHDIDHKACGDLSELEKQEFEKYLNHLKNCAGQGKVSKVITVPLFQSFITLYLCKIKIFLLNFVVVDYTTF